MSVPVPPLKEQRRMLDVIKGQAGAAQEEKGYREKLQHLKTGLMQDLLTGRVRVPEAKVRVDDVVA